MVIDPFNAQPLLAENACEAHLLPAAICPKSFTVKSNRQFDNLFGHQNDHHLITEVRTTLGHPVAADVLVADPKTGKTIKLRGDIDTKSVDPLTKLWNGSFSIKYPAGTSDAWRERIMSVDTIVRLSEGRANPYRSSLSSLHSGFLTAFHHWGASYATSPSAQHVAQILKKSVCDEVDEDIQEIAIRLRRAHKGLVRRMTLDGIRQTSSIALQLHPHPLLMIGAGELCCIAAILKYDDSFVMTTLLPAVDDSEGLEWIQILDLLASERKFSLCARTLTPHPASQGLEARWKDIRERFKRGNAVPSKITGL